MKKQFHQSTKMLMIILAVIFFTSCQKHKREIESLNFSKDSVQSIVGERDASILEYVGSFNEIQDKLDSIKQIQKKVSMQMIGDGTELLKSQKDIILEDVALLNDLIEQNKILIGKLQSKLKNSNLSIAELEKMLTNLTRQIEEKDIEIADLNSLTEKMKSDISNLNINIKELNVESQSKSDTIEMQVKQMNKMNVAYYCFGTKEELITNNVIEKTGGFIGMGKTLKIKKDFNPDYFTKVDMRSFDEVILGTKTAEFISTHPEGSCHFEGEEDLVVKLIIDQPADFWKVNRYMVILTEVKK